MTLVEGAPQLLPREEAFAGEDLADALRERFGVDVRTGDESRIGRGRRVGIGAELERRRDARGDQILVAVGRVPHTADLDLDAAGTSRTSTAPRHRRAVRVGAAVALRDRQHKRPCPVHPHRQVPRLGRRRGSARARDRCVAEGIGSPRVTFTDPQVAAAGKTLDQAREAGIDARAIDVPRRQPRRQLPARDRRHLPLVVDRTSGTIVGATFTGFETADFLQAATVAIVGEVPFSRLRHAFAPYPSRSGIG